MKDIFKRVLLLLPLLGVMLFSFSSCAEDETTDRYVLWFPDTTDIVYDESEWADKVYVESLTGYTVIPTYLGYGPLQLDVEYTSSGVLNVGEWNWSSTDESVAVVNSEGTVYLVGAGETVIEVAILPSETSATTCRDWIKITVDESLVLAEEISVSAPAGSMINNDGVTQIYEGGYTMQLTAEVSKTSSDPLMGNDATYNTFKWYSSNPGVASIDEDTGLVQTKSIPIAPIEVEMWATAVDGSEVTNYITLSVIAAVAPDAIYFSDATKALDGGILARNIGKFTLEHEMIPADATPGLIQWTSSNEDVLSVAEGGVVTFNGAFGYDITITASCYGSDEVEKITVSVPAGYFYEDFTLDKGDYESDGGYDDYGYVRWLWGPQTNGFNQDTDGGVQFDWKEGVDGVHFMQFTSWTSSGTERADLMCTQVDDMGMNTTYPFVVWHIDNVDVLYADYSPNQGMNFDISDTTNGITTYPGGKTTQYTKYTEYDEKTMFIVMDIREICDTNADSYLIDFLPTAVGSEWTPTAFNMAHTGLGVMPDGVATTFNLYKVFSLPSDTNITTYLESYMETFVNPDPDRYDE